MVNCKWALCTAMGAWTGWLQHRSSTPWNLKLASQLLINVIRRHLKIKIKIKNLLPYLEKLRWVDAKKTFLCSLIADLNALCMLQVTSGVDGQWIVHLASNPLSKSKSRARENWYRTVAVPKLGTVNVSLCLFISFQEQTRKLSQQISWFAPEVQKVQ